MPLRPPPCAVCGQPVVWSRLTSLPRSLGLLLQPGWEHARLGTTDHQATPYNLSGGRILEAA